MIWGQVVDHNLDLTPGSKDEGAVLQVPCGDIHFVSFSSFDLRGPFQYLRS